VVIAALELVIKVSVVGSDVMESISVVNISVDSNVVISEFVVRRLSEVVRPPSVVDISEDSDVVMLLSVVDISEGSAGSTVVTLLSVVDTWGDVDVGD